MLSKINKKILHFVTFFLIFSLKISYSSANSEKNSDQLYTETCVNTEGQPVDWYLILLFPENSSPGGKLSYGYFDNKSSKIQYYEYDYETFPPLYFTKNLDKKFKTNYVFWNDDKSTENHKEDAPASKAHAKGSLIYNALGGKFLMHSLPRFPRRTDDNKIITDLPENAGIYAQHFLCLTLQANEAVNMIRNLIVTSPYIVYQHGLKDLVGLNPEIVENFLNNKTDRKRSDFRNGTVKTKEGFGFDFFAKSSLIPDLPFEKMIPMTYESSVFVETWNKPEMLPNYCGESYQVMNVKKLKFFDFEFTTYKEHSKWGVLRDKAVTCFSDLNRIESQRKRGGMTLCIRKENLTNEMRKGIVDYEKCERTDKGFLKYLD